MPNSLKRIFLNWSNVKAFFHHPVIKISYLVVIGLPIVIELLEAAHILPKISDSIYEIFYSGIVMLISRVIYGLAAPREIKDYTDYHQYVEKHRESLLNYNPDKKLSVVMIHLDETEASQRRQIEMLHKTLVEQSDLGIKQTLEAQLTLLVTPLYSGCVTRYLEKEWYNADKNINKGALWICFLLNTAASILAVLVFIHRAKIVIGHNLSL